MKENLKMELLVGVLFVETMQILIVKIGRFPYAQQYARKSI